MKNCIRTFTRNRRVFSWECEKIFSMQLLFLGALSSVQLKSFFPKINPFHVNVPFLYHLKTSENLWSSDVFRGYRNCKFTSNGFIKGRYLTHSDKCSLYIPPKTSENQKQPQRALHQKFCRYLLSENIFLKIIT